MKAVLVPIKNLDNVKQRLSTLLDPSERQRLVQFMLRDVALALQGLGKEVRVVFASGDSWVHEFVDQHGWEMLRENNQASESRSVDWASQILEKRGFEAVLRLPGDIPLVRPSDVAQVFQAISSDRTAVMVPSADGTGTNALLRSPPTAFPSRFGPGSLQLHLQEAKRREVLCKVCLNPRIALDLDTAQDLAEFARQGSGTQTWSWLEKSGILTRLPSSFERRVSKDE